MGVPSRTATGGNRIRASALRTAPLIVYRAQPLNWPARTFADRSAQECNCEWFGGQPLISQASSSHGQARERL
jgi:hypothetical protein